MQRTLGIEPEYPAEVNERANAVPHVGVSPIQSS